MILLDANVLVYYLDETSNSHSSTVNTLQKLVDDDVQLTTSHHIVEEVLIVLSKLLPGVDLTKVVDKIAKLTNLFLVEPSPSLEFARRYATLSDKLKAGVNDALILQLMLDAGITTIFSYDKKLIKQAHVLNIETATPAD